MNFVAETRKFTTLSHSNAKELKEVGGRFPRGVKSGRFADPPASFRRSSYAGDLWISRLFRLIKQGK